MKRSDLDCLLRAAVLDGGVPGVVAGATDRSGLVYLGAFGSAAAGTQQPMRPETVFRLASMTKLVTSIAVLQLAAEGRVDVDAPFGRCLPEYRQPPVLRSFDFAQRRYETQPARRDVTVRDLLTHTAGYGTWFLNPELRVLAGPKPEYYNAPFLICEPGSRFQYGTSTDVVGQLVPALSGLRLDEYFAQRILGPLGMRDTAYVAPADTTRLAAVHVRAPTGFVAQPPEPPEAPRGGAGLFGTVADYLALLRMLLNGGRAAGRQVLDADAVAALTSNQIGDLMAVRQTTAAPERTSDFAFMDGTQKFGFGVMIETHARQSGRAAGSYAWAGIFNTFFWVDPAAGIAAVVCMQLSPFCTPASLAVCDAFEAELYRQLGFTA